MPFWTSARIQPKVKSRFVVNFGTFFLLNIKSITKPSMEINTKEVRLINHTINYPGNVKWNPVTLKFICMNPGDIRMDDNAKTSFDSGLDTSDLLWQMIRNTGYYYPSVDKHFLGRADRDPSSPAYTTMTTPEKASTVANSFGRGLYDKADYDAGGSPSRAEQRVVIQQLTSGGRPNVKGTDMTKFSREVFISEQWELINPLIKSVNFGDLAYDSDDFVEYSMDIVYDYAKYTHPSITAMDGGPMASTTLPYNFTN